MKEVLRTLGKDHRIEILESLEKEPRGIYDTYNALKIKSPDIYTSVVERALKELWEIDLVYRDEKKKFNITAYGTFILWNILNPPDPEIITYLKEKQIDLPEKFLKDMPRVLKNAFIVRGEMNITSQFLKVQEVAEKEIRFIIEKPLLSQKVMENNLNMIKRGVKFRSIMDKDNFKVYFDKEKMEELIDEKILNEHTQAFLLNQSGSDIKTRFLPNVKMKLYIADRKLVAIAFPDKDGNVHIDSAILSYDSRTIKWGQKVFEYYWQKSDCSMK